MKRPALRLHLTNIIGAGATQLLLSLLPALERSGVKITEIHLPDRGGLSMYQKAPDTGLAKHYRRRLPNALSRLLECLVFARRFDGNVPLLVLGDLPLRCRAPQTLFVQTSHLCRPERFSWSLSSLKFVVARLVFRLNARYVNAFIVQTSVMRDALSASYPTIANRVHIIAQPVPNWLLEISPCRSAVIGASRSKLKLIYPAAFYPHKNHKLLGEITPKLALSLPIEHLTLTISEDRHPAVNVPWIHCAGFLNSSDMISAYGEADGVLFLSTDESYGFPLVEAMFLGLPIVCPDLPYAHTLCADEAIYFDPNSIASLCLAISTLHKRLATGWSPDWSTQLVTIPKDWDTVAAQMIELACGPNTQSPMHHSFE